MWNDLLGNAQTPSKPRTKLGLESLEAREVPAFLEFTYNYGGPKDGHIAYSDSAVNVSLALQNVAITDFEFTYGSTVVTEADISSGSVIQLAYGVPVEVDIMVNSGVLLPAAVRIARGMDTVDVTMPATCTTLISDLPLTVTGGADTDATQGGSGGKFRFTRTGCTAQSLTVSYSVGGTATSGTEFTALAGTVTFAASASTIMESVDVLVCGSVGSDPPKLVGQGEHDTGSFPVYVP